MWCLLNTSTITLKAPRIRLAANVWVDKLSRHLASDEWD
jgi:hypothetical protein